MEGHDVDLERARVLVDDVLARPRFAEAEPSWVQRLLARLGDLLDPVLGRLDGSADLSPLAWLVVGATLGAVAWMLARAVRRRRAGAARIPADGPAGRPAVDWRAAAAEHARAGRHREAVACHLRAGVAELAAAGLVEEVAGRTVAEYAAELAEAAPRRVAAFRDAAAVFERTWYAGQPADAADVAAVAAAVARLSHDEVPPRSRPVGAPS